MPTKPTDSLGSLFSGDFFDNPYRYYRVLQSEHPVFWYPPLRSWLVTKYTDVNAGLRDARFSSGSGRFEKGIRIFADEAQVGARAFVAILKRMMVFLDEPDHVRLRKLLTGAFVPSAVEALRQKVRTYIGKLLTELRATSIVDFREDFAGQLPAFTICELLGVPFEDRAELLTNARALGAFFGAMPPTLDQLKDVCGATERMHEYFRWLLDHGESSEASILKRLRDIEMEGEHLDSAEIASQCIMFLFAGNETTQNLLVNCLYCFLTYPDVHSTLRSDFSLLGPAIEEVLRIESPSQFMSRMATQDLVIRDRAIETGQTVLFFMGAANRDLDAFECPDEFIINRTGPAHLSFGSGRHNCIGAALARIQVTSAFEALLESTSNIELAGAVEWIPNPNFRSLKTLNIRLEW